MKVSRKWLQEYVDGTLPEAGELAEVLSLHAFEVEGIEQKGDDDVIDIDVLPNRAHDCLGHLGVARECAALLKLGYKAPDVLVETDSSVKTGDELTLTVEDSKLVPRAMKRLVSNVNVGESPDWLKERLAVVGQKSINNIVDITNFVMLETGQPVHAFDAEKIEGNIIIRGAKGGEKLETLDGDTFELEEGMLVIADDEKALDIAGIKGGANSGIDENTTHIVISICNFNPTSIRKTSRALGLITDASKRFGQGLSPELPAQAMERTSQLIHELAGGKIAEDVLDEYPRPPHPYKVGMSVEEANKLLGLNLSESDVTDVFDRLGFSYERIENPMQKVLDDTSKYVGKEYVLTGTVIYDAPERFSCSSLTNFLFVQAGVALPSLSIDQYVFGEPVEPDEARAGDLVFSNTGEETHRKVRRESVEFLPGTPVPEGVNHCGLYLGDGKVLHAGQAQGGVVIEKLTESPQFKNDTRFRRISISGPRIAVTIPHERLDLRIKQDLIEEVGRVYGYGNIKATVPETRKEPEVNKEFYYTNKIRDVLVGEGFSEVYNYTFSPQQFTQEGDIEVLNPINKEKPFLRSNLARGLINRSMEIASRNKDLLGLERIKIFEIGTVFGKGGESLSLGMLVNGKNASDILDETLSVLANEIDVGWNLSLAGADLESPEEYSYRLYDLDKFIDKLPEPKNYDDFAELDSGSVTFKEISQYPFVARDISLWVPSGTKYTDVWEVIWKTGKSSGLLRDRIFVFDNYIKRDDKGNEERRSYAFRLVFQSYERTLTDDEVNEVMDTIYKAVEQKGWEVR